MQVFYASKNRNKRHKQDPDYWIYPRKQDESDTEQTESNVRQKRKESRRPVGKMYKNRSRRGTQYLTVYLFDTVNKTT